ncbi:hypothetical protein [Atribacter laminatus]|uniref:Uncharacterized protein n=1 Tax=Atribacter laminatus TaxID=2847778 RepID=A0A7T1AMJ7_ATRLM|nr:hypothetical protein [Atribacter laminatus]QPM68676.1 hypothetical protein RT761_01898 [Atribacter laminatus]
MKNAEGERGRGGEKAEKKGAQDDRLKNSYDNIFVMDPQATLVESDENENPIYDMPWHVATLIKERSQFIMPQQFSILL